ncbi:MAG: 37S ribosomal protein S9, mitochondrial, partial [Marteilia pararefringens]
MPDPDDIYENYDQLNIDLKGRPSDLFFYTGKPKFFRTLFNIRTEVNRLMEKTELAEHDSKINSETIRYLSLQEFRELHIGEYLNEKEYRQFALLMNRFILLNDRFDTRSDEKMLKYFKLYVNEETKFTLPKIFYDKESGRNFTSISSSKKHSKVCVTVYEKGTGKFIINNKHDLLYFKNYQR